MSETSSNRGRFGSYDVRVAQELSATEPVTLAEAADWLRIKPGETLSDARVTSLIKTARKRAERFINKDIIGKNRVIFWSYIDNEDVNFPYTISSLDTITLDGVVVAESQYELLGLDNPVLRMLQGQVEKVQVEYTTASIADDDEIKNGILMLVEEMFHEVKTPWKAVLSPFKVFGYYGQK